MSGLSLKRICLSALLSTLPAAAWAVEGGSGAYFLGSRDFASGIVPPPGIYQTNEFAYLSGSVDRLAIGGVALGYSRIDAFIYKPGVTYVPDIEVFGGRAGLSVQLPIVHETIDFSGVVGSSITGTLSDRETGFGDLVVSPFVGWDNGHWHYSLGATFFLPTGQYGTATIDVAKRQVDVLSVGKNKFAIDPTFSVTYLNPNNGFELSGSVGVTLSSNNNATDYQTAPELHVELTVGQHLPNGLVIGVSGYAYQQLADDSGSGADSFKAVTGARSLQARVFGIGPAIAWGTKIGDVGVTVKAKYMHEFGAKRRFESDVFFGSVSLAF